MKNNHTNWVTKLNRQYFITVLVLALISSSYAALSCSGNLCVLNQIHQESGDDFSLLPTSYPSQIFSDAPLSHSMVIDDFTVNSTTLSISRVSALFRAQSGFTSFQDISKFSVSIFSSIENASTNIIGDIAYHELGLSEGVSITQVIDGSGNFEYGLVNISLLLALPGPGTYWIGIAPNAESGKQFFLQSADPLVSGGQNSLFINPGEGFAVGTMVHIGHDASYSITAIPEPSCLTYTLAMVMCLGLYRHRSPSSSTF